MWEIVKMLRNFFFSTGVFVALWGLSLLAVDKLVLNSPPDDKPGVRAMMVQLTVDKEKRPVIDPPDWAAYLLMSIGSVTVLYSAALPARKD